ncbi:MAG: hypothetical protein KDB87_16125, partial [Flavobacteriales bacterium]|nr:hypothetical protein [Flavobacteriales bacterium]
RDAFVAKFSSAGVRQWGTYHGGADADEAGDLATDNAGNVYLNGNTMSPTVMSTPGAYQTAIAGLEDAFVAKFSPAGDHGWGTYYGGPDVEDSWGVAVDALGSVYICGTTLSTTGIATAGAHQTVYATQDDAYLAKFNEHEIGSILYAGECVTRQYIYDYSGVGAGTYDLSVGIDADTVALGDDPPVILPDVGFNAGTYVNIDGFNGAAHTSDDVTIPPGGVNCPPGDQLSIAVDIPTASSCGNGNYVQATVTITNTSGLVAFDTELLLGLTGTGATFASEPYGLTAGLVLAAPNLLDPAYPAVPNAIYGLAGSQTLPVPEIPPGTSTFVVDLNVGSTLTNLSAQLDSIHSSFNASGQSNLATDAGGVTVFSDPVINGFTCPGSIVAGNTITLNGISVSGATTVNWSSTSMATLPNSGSVAGPVLVYTPTPMDVANGFVALSLTATNAGGCETTVSCQVLLTNVQYDYGDAPVTYDLNVNYQPPAAASTLFSGMFLGATSPGTELLANNSVMADGDGNEEDGLSANPYTAPWPGPGLPFDPVVTATNTTPKAGHLHGYVDWNADGDFLDTLESSLNTPAVPASSGSQAYVLNFTVPPGVNTAGLFYIRLRLSTDSLAVTIPYMAAPEGETEDYVWNSVGQLPVEMISFTAVPWSDEVMAEWVTASEYNSAWFVLERSASLSGFTPIAQLPAAGMSVTQR